jgi:hypothetical protein
VVCIGSARRDQVRSGPKQDLLYAERYSFDR